jgi:hypothetical protein
MWICTNLYSLRFGKSDGNNFCSQPGIQTFPDASNTHQQVNKDEQPSSLMLQFSGPEAAPK